MTPTEALTRLHAAGRIRSAWLPGMLTLQYDVPARLAWIDKAGRWNLSGNSGEWLRYASMDGIVLDPSDPATMGCLLALLREAVGSPYLSPVWNAYLGRRYDPSDPGPDDFDNPPGDVSLDNARQWRIELCGAPDEVYDRLGTDLLGEGATDYDAVVAALDFVAGRLA